MEDFDVGIAITFGAATLRERAATGEAMLEGLYDEYAHSLYRYALSILGTPEDAEDAVQELFIRLAREHKRLKGIRNMKAYLFTGARNTAYNILRSRKRKDKLNEAMCSDFLVRFASHTVDRSEELCEAFAALSIEQREVLALKIFDGMTLNEIAQTIGASINTVGSRYRYGIAKLREALKQDT